MNIYYFNQRVFGKFAGLSVDFQIYNDPVLLQHNHENDDLLQKLLVYLTKNNNNNTNNNKHNNNNVLNSLSKDVKNIQFSQFFNIQIALTVIGQLWNRLTVIACYTHYIIIMCIYFRHTLNMTLSLYNIS